MHLNRWFKWFTTFSIKRTRIRKHARFKSSSPATYLRKTKRHLAKTCLIYKRQKTRIPRFFPIEIWTLETTKIGRKRDGIFAEFDTDSYPIRIDSHCSYCITSSKGDFIDTPRKVHVKITGVGGLQTSSLKGTIRWNWTDDSGQNISVDIPGTYYIPNGPGRILSPQHWAQVLRTQGDPTAHTIGNWNRIQLFQRNGSSVTTVRLSRSGNVPILMSAPGFSRARKHTSKILNKINPVAFPSYITDDEGDGDDSTELQEDFTVQGNSRLLENSSNYQLTPEEQARPVTVTFDVSRESSLHKIPDDDPPEEWENFTPQALFLHWHYRLNHPPMKDIIELAKKGKLPKKILQARPPKCPACLSGKATKRPWRTRAPANALSVPTVNAAGDAVAVDQLESTTPGLLAQMRGFITNRRLHHATVFVDMFSHVGFVHCQETTGGEDTIKAKEAFELWARNRGVRIRHYHADNGRFAEKLWTDHCKSHGQTYSFCGVNAHHQNGVAERRIRELQERARTALIHAVRRWPDAINAYLWPHALRTANETFNNTPKNGTSSPIENFSQIPIEVRLRNYHPFGCPAYVLDSDLATGKRMTRHKWGDRARVGINLGPSANHAANVSLILNLQTGLVSPQFHVRYDDHFETVRRDAAIDVPRSQWQEKCHFRRRNPVRRQSSNAPLQTTRERTEHNPSSSRSLPTPRANVSPPNAQDTSVTVDVPTAANEGAELPNTEVLQSSSAALGRATGGVNTRYGRQTRPPNRLLQGMSAVINYDGTGELQFQEQHPLIAFAASADPDTLYMHEAMAAPDRDKFLQSMDDEVRDHEKRGHWKIIPRSLVPKGHTILPMVWAMKRKRKIQTNEVYKWKSRLNVGGHKQTHGENYWDTHSPTLAWPIIRFFLIISIIRGWTTRQLDFVQAYPQADAEVPMYLHLPPGYNYKGTRGNHVLKLLRNIYGAKQAGLIWYKHLKMVLLKLGFKMSSIDKCIFYKERSVLLVYVDDCILMGPSKDEINEIISDLQGELRMEDQGNLDDYLGVNIKREKDNSFTLSQPHLITSILKDLNLDQDNVKGCTTPALSTKLLHADLEGEDFDEQFNYRRVVGKLNYLERSTRPDLAFAVHQCARFCSNPKQSHAKAIKRIGRYLYATRTRGYNLQPRGEDFEVWVDASFGGEWDKNRSTQASSDPNMARSRTGFGIFYAKCLLLCQSKLQTEIALSTTEAEFIALSQATREVIHLMSIIDEAIRFGVPIRDKTAKVKCTVFEDNTGAVEIAKIPRIRPRTKHINVKYWHFIKWVESARIIIQHVGTDKQLADIWTKPLDEKLFVYFRDLIMHWKQYNRCEGVKD